MFTVRTPYRIEERRVWYAPWKKAWCVANDETRFSYFVGGKESAKSLAFIMNEKHYRA